MRFSGHNLSLRELMAKHDLTGQIKIVEMNPPDMASALASESDLSAYYVGEPFASKTLKNGLSDLVFHVEEVWPSFICNLVLVKQSTIDRDPKAVRLLVQGAARSGLWAEKHQDQAAEISAQYWSQPVELVKYALQGRKVIFDQYLPKEEEMQEIADLMVKYGLIDDNRIDGLVDARFAAGAKQEGIDALDDILP
jgi:NitT/TauT family transport system substrate-binding protein